MNKFWLSVMTTVALTIGSAGFLVLETNAEEIPDVKLTEEQQKDMAGLQKQVLDQQKKIINKYVEYGVFTEEKGQKIISHFEKRYNMLEQNGFVPKWDKKHKKHHQED